MQFGAANVDYAQVKRSAGREMVNWEEYDMYGREEWFPTLTD